MAAKAAAEAHKLVDKIMEELALDQKEFADHTLQTSFLLAFKAASQSTSSIYAKDPKSLAEAMKREDANK